jgi:hypothetical protein
MNARDAQKQAARAQAAAPAMAATAMAAPAMAAPVAASGGLTEDAIARLKQLGELHAAGVLTDVEFAEAKARILTA